MDWPKKTTYWQEGDTRYASIPFTWELPNVMREIEADIFSHKWVVGGPGVKLMPWYFEKEPNVTVAHSYPGVLQKVNPQATRTTEGCPRRCEFCGIGARKIEGDFRELEDWLDLPVICDNNLLASSMPHFHRVCDRLQNHPSCDFNQGLDARLLTPEHAKRLAALPDPVIRLALDTDSSMKPWALAYERLRLDGVTKAAIRTYVLIGFLGDPEADIRRCEFVEAHGVKAFPMWFHNLTQLKYNEVTENQRLLGWDEEKQKQIMGYYYQHRGSLALRGEEK